jgi:hypothetical protein
MVFAASEDWALSTGDFTIEWFHYETASNRFSRIFEIPNGSTLNKIAFSIEETERYGLLWEPRNLNTNVSIAAGQWHHIAIVKIGSTIKLYRNGIEFYTVQNTENFSNNNNVLTIANEFNEGTRNILTSFEGHISNFRWIKGLGVYTGNFTTPTSRLHATAVANPYGGSNTLSIPEGVTKLLLVP